MECDDEENTECGKRSREVNGSKDLSSDEENGLAWTTCVLVMVTCSTYNGQPLHYYDVIGLNVLGRFRPFHAVINKRPSAETRDSHVTSILRGDIFARQAAQFSSPLLLSYLIRFATRERV